MAPLFRLIKEIDSSKTQWALKIRLIRAYKAPALGSKNYQNLECIFHDTEGTRVHATINQTYINRFESMLVEGRLFAVKNFVVTVNKNKFKTTKNHKQIIFINDTKVVELFDEEFPTLLYDFQPFSELSIVEKLNDTQMIDVIGRIVKIEEPRLVNYSESKREGVLMEIILEDLEKQQMKCTLWGDYVDQMMEHIRNVGPDPTILIVQFCRGKYYRDAVTVTSTLHATKLIFNAECREVEAYKMRFKDDHIPLYVPNSTPISSSSKESGSISNIVVQIRTIQQIKENKEVGTFWVLASMVSIETFGDWWYLACQKCKRKVQKAKHGFLCSSCNKIDSSGIPRYKIQVRVQDHTDNTLLLLWDEQCIQLIGKTVTQLLEEYEDEKNIQISDVFTISLDKEMFFKIQVKEDQIEDYNGAYSVLKLTEDKSLMSKLNDGRCESHESTHISKLHVEGMEDSGLKRKLMDEFSSTTSDKKKMLIKQEDA